MVGASRPVLPAPMGKSSKRSELSLARLRQGPDAAWASKKRTRPGIEVPGFPLRRQWPIPAPGRLISRLLVDTLRAVPLNGYQADREGLRPKSAGDEETPVA